MANLGQNRAAVGIGVLVLVEGLTNAFKGIFKALDVKPNQNKFIKSPKECFNTAELR